MALSRRSLVTLSMLAGASLTAEALTVEAGTIVGVSVDAPVFDLRSSAPYGCPPAGCLGDNTRVSASWESKRARHLSAVWARVSSLSVRCSTVVVDYSSWHSLQQQSVHVVFSHPLVLISPRKIFCTRA